MTTQTSKGRAPTHAAYQIRHFTMAGKQKSHWTRIGSAWLHKDGAGFNVQLDAYPVNGELTIYVIADRKDEDVAPPTGPA